MQHNAKTTKTCYFQYHAKKLNKEKNIQLWQQRGYSTLTAVQRLVLIQQLIHYTPLSTGLNFDKLCCTKECMNTGWAKKTGPV